MGHMQTRGQTSLLLYVCTGKFYAPTLLHLPSFSTIDEILLPIASAYYLHEDFPLPGFFPYKCNVWFINGNGFQNPVQQLNKVLILIVASLLSVG